MILEKTLKILQQPVCDHCLGRQFGQLLHGFSNDERGKILRTAAAFALDHEEKNTTIDMSNFHDIRFHHQENQKGARSVCSICRDLFTQLDVWATKAAKKMKDVECSTFLVGTKPPAEVIEQEEQLWERVGIDYCEPINAEINREVGKRVEKIRGIKFDPKRPQVALLLNMEANSVEMLVNPLFIYGEYQKLKRGIPQTRWPSGKYKTSVEQIIAKPYMQATGGKSHKLHGMGREDIDARCLGWRPFVLEILSPKKRSVNLNTLAKRIGAAVKVQNLRFVVTDEVRRVKEARPDKTYRILITTKDGFTKDDLKKIKSITEVHQNTPTRVEHRRAIKLRKRKVKAIQGKLKSKNWMELTVTGEAGLYIKELVTGDNGKTTPSISAVLQKPCTFKDLDVLRIHF